MTELTDAPLEPADALDWWKGEGGAAYAIRNPASAEEIGNRRSFWRRVMKSIPVNDPQSILEVGANIGLNLRALRADMPRAILVGIEPNVDAAKTLRDSGVANSVVTGDHRSLRAMTAEMVFTYGVLIHIPPNDLYEACKAIYRASTRWILCAEYFSQKLRTIEYQNSKGLLWARDFGSYWLDHFEGLKVVDYGFEWKRLTGLDDVTWTLFEKPR